MDIGPFLFLEVFSLLMTILIILKKSMGKAFVCVIWGVVGIVIIVAIFACLYEVFRKFGRH